MLGILYKGGTKAKQRPRKKIVSNVFSEFSVKHLDRTSIVVNRKKNVPIVNLRNIVKELLIIVSKIVFTFI